MYDECVMLSMRFPQKLWKIVNECDTGAIKWSRSGCTILLDYKKFQDEYLAAENPIFKTSNITSFIRQLNLYGFRKVTSHNRDPICNSNNPDIHEFLHENFRYERSDLLGKVCRKAAACNGNRSRSYERRGENGCANRPNAHSNKRYESAGRTKIHKMTRLQICQVTKRGRDECCRQRRSAQLASVNRERGALSTIRSRITGGCVQRFSQFNYYALTRALEQATREYRREKMLGEVFKDEAMIELENLENEVGAVWARRYELTPLLRNS